MPGTDNSINDPNNLPPHTQFLDLTNGKGGERSDNSHGGDDDEDDGGGIDSGITHAAANDPSGGGSIDPDTPGKVVEAGQEHTGRWTKEEHEAFLAALHMYGKEWKKVAAKVKTRTVVQTRTHAQKYFQKLQKTMDTQGGTSDFVVTQLATGVPAAGDSAKKASAQKKKKARTATSTSVLPSISVAAKQNRRGSSATLNAAQVISGLSHSQPSMGGYVAIGSSAVLGGHAPRHGFSTSTTEAPPAFSSFYGASTASDWMSGTGAVKIVAPDPTEALRRGDFPEPSPAATGKRKLAEIAAARMLAGVAGGQQQQELDSKEGPPTPPPPAPLNMKDAPAPPLFGGDSARDGSSALAMAKGLSLQIVNPETLGVTYDTKKKGEDGSPVTPWDGQLEALVSEKKAKINETKLDESEKKLAAANCSIFPAVTGPSTAYGRSALHQSVCDMDLIGLQKHLSVLANLSDGVLQRADEAGYCPIHTASSLSLKYPGQAAQVGELVRMLLGAGADPTRRDRHGNTPLHWSARSGDRHVTELLLNKNCPREAKNHAGETALHWAMRAGRRGTEVVDVLLENGARPGVLNNDFRRPIDVAADGYLDNPLSLTALRLKDVQQQRKTPSREYKKTFKDTASSRREARANLLIRSLQSRTLVLHHPECSEHIPKSEHDWEAPDRVTSIMRRIVPSSDSTGATETSGIFPYEVTVSKEFERAKLDLLSRIHTPEYLSFVNELSKDLERQLKEGDATSEKESDSGFGSPPVVPFTPMVQRSMIKIAESSVKLGTNSDTSFSAGSLRAARRATGAVQHAVDCVLVGRNRNAFCVVRPPGHHAGSNGLLDGGESCGFCIFNNVAAGAMYAISDDRLLCERCAIVDIDVHHGNGTEEIVRKCHDPSKLFFFSVHLYDNDKRKRSGNQFQYKFYPGTGADDDLPMNIINVPIAPLWKEISSPPPSSAASSPNTRRHNTRLKTRHSQSQESVEDTSSELGTPRDFPANSDHGSETGSTNIGSTNIGSSAATAVSSGRQAYRQAIQSRLLPALRAFNPDLILISAGFDAAKGDVGNARHEQGGKEKMGIDLEPEDYAWTTRKICEIADICCQGRVVSVLEGGYGRTPPTAPGETETDAGEHPSLDRTVFAECAVRHLNALIDPHNLESRFS